LYEKGLAGLLPVHPNSFLIAYKNRRKIAEEKQKELEEKAKIENEAKAKKAENAENAEKAE
jgi:hypothetical protein